MQEEFPVKTFQTRQDENNNCLAQIKKSPFVYFTFLLRFPHKNDVPFLFTFIWLQKGSCLIYVICAYLRIVVSNTYCVVFCCVFLRLVYPMLLVSLDCPFLIATSVYSNFLYLRDQIFSVPSMYPGIFFSKVTSQLIQ